MKTALVAQQIATATSYFVEETQGLYTDIFNELYDSLPQIVANMADIELVSVRNNIAKFRITRDELHARSGVIH